MKLNKFIKSFLYGALICLAGIFGVAYYTVRSTTFRKASTPERLATIATERAELVQKYGAEHISLTTADGLKLAGLLIERPRAERVVVLCHGFGMCKEYMKRFVTVFPHDTIILFDFRAHGESEGNIVSIGHYEQQDVHAVVAFIRSHESIRHLPIVGLGTSMGGATVLGAASTGADFKALIIDSSFANLQEQVAHSFVEQTGLPRIIFMPAVVALFQIIAGCGPSMVTPAQFIKNIQCPVLLIHSEQDAMTPVANAYRLYAAAQGTKELWLVKDAVHARVVNAYPAEYAQKVRQFLENTT